LASLKDAILHITRTNQYETLYFDKAYIYLEVLISKFCKIIYHITF